MNIIYVIQSIPNYIRSFFPYRYEIHLILKNRATGVVVSTTVISRHRFKYTANVSLNEYIGNDLLKNLDSDARFTTEYKLVKLNP